jgi:putative FmdB family regulatory protein
MPIFEYKCEDCGEVNEFLILKGDEPEMCIICGGKRLTKLMSAHNAPAASPDRKPPVHSRCCGSDQGCGNPGGFCCS